MPPADLYLLRLQWLPYLTLEECQAAGAVNCEDFLGRLQNRSLNLKDASGLSPQKRYALQLALQGAELVPPVEALPLPQPTRAGLHEINAPGPQAPVMVSGNSEITLTVLSSVLATTVSPFYLLLVDTFGRYPGYGIDIREIYPGQSGRGAGRSASGSESPASYPGYPRVGRSPESISGRSYRLGSAGGTNLCPGIAALFWGLLAAAPGQLAQNS